MFSGLEELILNVGEKKENQTPTAKDAQRNQVAPNYIYPKSEPNLQSAYVFPSGETAKKPVAQSEGGK